MRLDTPDDTHLVMYSSLAASSLVNHGSRSIFKIWRLTSFYQAAWQALKQRVNGLHKSHSNVEAESNKSINAINILTSTWFHNCLTWYVPSFSTSGHSQRGNPGSPARCPLQNDQSDAGIQPSTVRGRNLLQAGVLHVHIRKHSKYSSPHFDNVFVGRVFFFSWCINCGSWTGDLGESFQ